MKKRRWPFVFFSHLRRRLRQQAKWDSSRSASRYLKLIFKNPLRQTEGVEQMQIKHAVLTITLLGTFFALLNSAEPQAPPSVPVRGGVGPVGPGFTVKIVGRKQGLFKGEARGAIEGIRFSEQLNSPRDVATGMASGKRQYSPITFTKEWGPASPQIMQACSTNETLTSVTFEFSRTDLTGKEFVYQTIILTNATISSVRRYIGGSVGAEPPDARPLEDVSFTFQKFELRDAAGAMALDDWSAPL